MLEYIESFFKYLLIGILSGYLLIYGLRPSIPYPEYVLELFEHKWMFVIILAINYYIFIWDLRAGFLMLLSVIALIFDIILFTKGHAEDIKKPEVTIDDIHYVSLL